MDDYETIAKQLVGIAATPWSVASTLEGKWEARDESKTLEEAIDGVLDHYARFINTEHTYSTEEKVRDTEVLLKRSIRKKRDAEETQTEEKGQ